MNNNIQIRHAELSDLTEMQELYVDTITSICKDDYSPEQIRAWASLAENTQRWTDRLSTQYILVACIENKIVGYASLDNSDCLDVLYVHKDYQRHGIADKLYSEIEKEAIKRNTKILNSNVSETAKRFFEKHGFQIVAEQNNVINDVNIINYKMTKQLDSSY